MECFKVCSSRRFGAPVAAAARRCRQYGRVVGSFESDLLALGSWTIVDHPTLQPGRDCYT